MATAGRAFGVWNHKDSTFQFKLPSGIFKPDVTFMGTSGVHKFHFTSDSAQASHVAWEHLDYDHILSFWIMHSPIAVDTPKWWNNHYQGNQDLQIITTLPGLLECW